MTVRISYGLTDLSLGDRQRLVREVREKLAQRYGDRYRGRPVTIYPDFDGQGIMVHKKPDESLDISTYDDPSDEWFPL
jgi:hypothetical protein